MAPEVKYVVCNQSMQGSEGCFVCQPIRQKSQILDYEQTTRKVIYQASFSPRLPNKREKGPPDRRLRLA